LRVKRSLEYSRGGDVIADDDVTANYANHNVKWTFSLNLCISILSLICRRRCRGCLFLFHIFTMNYFLIEWKQKQEKISDVSVNMIKTEAVDK